MAPELFSEAYTYQAEVWSVGVVFFYMLTGNFPFSKPRLIQASLISSTNGFRPNATAFPSKRKRARRICNLVRRMRVVWRSYSQGSSKWSMRTGLACTCSSWILSSWASSKTLKLKTPKFSIVTHHQCTPHTSQNRCLQFIGQVNTGSPSLLGSGSRRNRKRNTKVQITEADRRITSRSQSTNSYQSQSPKIQLQYKLGLKSKRNPKPYK